MMPLLGGRHAAIPGDASRLMAGAADALAFKALNVSQENYGHGELAAPESPSGNLEQGLEATRSPANQRLRLRELSIIHPPLPRRHPVGRGQSASLDEVTPPILKLQECFEVIMGITE